MTDLEIQNEYKPLNIKDVARKINLESIADKSLDSQIESLSTQLDVSGLEQVSELKLTLKK